MSAISKVSLKREFLVGNNPILKRMVGPYGAAGSKCGYYKWSIRISTFISTIYLKIQIRNPSRNISRYILRAGYI
jgi:hypothetical protein